MSACSKVTVRAPGREARLTASEDGICHGGSKNSQVKMMGAMGRVCVGIPFSQSKQNPKGGKGLVFHFAEAKQDP